MQGIDLNRRQFLQLGVGAALTSQSLTSAWAGDAWLSTRSGHLTQVDPHLALAWAHQFADHDLEGWWQSTRLCGALPQQQLGSLQALLGGQGEIQSTVPAGEDAWVTLNMQTPALRRLLEGGMGLFKEHLWGAPWFNPIHRPRSQAFSNDLGLGVPNPAMAGPALPLGTAGRQRLLVIDHGFPIQHLRQQGVPHLHRVSPFNRVTRRPQPRTHSHGAQVTGLLMHGLYGRGPRPDAPLLLYELPNEILDSMPYAALWAEIVDAITWALSVSSRGSEWIVMLSLVSTDADRHPESFMSRCARVLNAHAQSLGVHLTWVMAAGNSHADQQNLALKVQAGRPVAMQWHLPAQNHRASFLECWHDTAMGVPQIEMQAPGGDWSKVCRPMSMASRVHEPSARTQTVLRLAPTTAWTPGQALASSGAWLLRWTFEREGLLNTHLSMMTSSDHGGLRQARIEASSLHPQEPHDTVTLSGLIPSTSHVVVAQTLHHAVDSPWLEHPTPDQLSPYCGRGSAERMADQARAIGFKIDDSPVQRGALTWSLHGHRIHRVSGTSMAVPLAARWLMGLD